MKLLLNKQHQSEMLNIPPVNVSRHKSFLQPNAQIEKEDMQLRVLKTLSLISCTAVLECQKH